MRPATKRQRWALFCITKKDYRNADVSFEEASRIISEANENKPDYAAIWNEASEAGLKALRECKPTPMVVQQHANVLDDNSPVVKQWGAPEGVCGFAWINVKGNTGFARWASKNKNSLDFGRSQYYGGYNIGAPREAGQSYERKCAWASAFAEVLDKYSIWTCIYSRLD